MVRLSAFAAAFVLLLPGIAGARPAAETRALQAAPPPLITLVVSGRGWGHGVGMSQWGAYGFARNGHSYAEILAHYYSGTELGRTPVGRVRVLLVEGRQALAVGSRAPFTVRDGSGATHELPAGTYRFGPDLRVAEGLELAPPLVFTASSAPLALDGRRYRGTLEVSVEKNRLRAINPVGLEQYLFGVVPGEVPSGWPAEALKAQAVVARSYAIAGRRSGGAFDLYADVRSQVYKGLDGEASATTAAVQATRGEVVLHEGKVATTYFFSTSGGKTADVTEAWSGSKPVPYLVSVPDPYDSASPVHTWGPVAVPAGKLRKALELRAAPVDVRIRTGPSGRATELVFTLANGARVAVPGPDARFALGLRSTWVRLGVLALRPAASGPVTFGTKTRLSGRVRGVGKVVLQRRGIGGTWEQVAELKPAENGTFALPPFKPAATASYRLAAGRVASAPLRVAVAPRVGLQAGAGLLRGTARPVLPGATVVVQRQEGARWVQAGSAVLDDRGAFVVALDLVPGTYRARLAPGRGFAAGLSRTLSVGGS